MGEFKTAAVQDSAEAGRPRQRRNTAHMTGFAQAKYSLTVGNIIHFVVAAFFLLPVFVIVATFVSLGDLLNFIRYAIEACVSSAYWLMRVIEEGIAAATSHKHDPAFQRARGRRRALGATVEQDWRKAGRALLNVGRAWSKVFGLGGLFASMEERVQRANRDWRLYAVDMPWSRNDQPAEFPENYVVVDELPPGGSSARLYVVRKRTEEQNGPLAVLKYFDLRNGGNLESVVRESQAVELAKRLGLITESNLGTTAFWYVMPYYHGETLTKGVLRNFKQATESGSQAAHTRMSLGYVHQLLQVIAQYHEAGVIHKDIKPDNLIIAGERIYLIDIGLMTPLSSMAQLTTHGTEYFRDPEMVRLALQGREVREVDAAKFDVYSIGAVLFFAVSGEFPTSGALSRLPNNVPVAVQWVVNRAMTGMDQRYANARAMLTDVDYLFWAASTGSLEQLKPADLPSFKGMPVPPHLAASPANDTQIRERMAAAPGGYGAWYAAPAYARPRARSGSGLKLALLILLLVFAAGLWLLTFMPRSGDPQAVAHMEYPRSAQRERLVELLPDKKSPLVPLYAWIDDTLAAGIRVEGNGVTSDSDRVNLADETLAVVSTRATHWRSKILGEIWKRQKPRNADHAFPDEAPLLFVSVEQNPEKMELVQAIRDELTIEAARRQRRVLASDDRAARGLNLLFLGLTDDPTLHREIARRFASEGRLPPVIVDIHMEMMGEFEVLNVRMTFPGREYTFHKRIRHDLRRD